MASLAKLRPLRATARTGLVLLLLTPRLLAQAGPYEPFYARGTRLEREGKYEEALEELKKAANLAPKNPRVLNALGAVLSQLSHLEEADKAYGAALAVAPDFLPARKNRATNAFLRGDFRFADSEFKALTRLRPKDFVPPLFLGLLAIERADYQEARSHLLRARQLGPRDGRVLLALTRTHFMLGERQSATETANAMRTNSNAKFAERFDLGVLLASFEADAEAADVFNDLWQTKPDTYEVGYNLALVQNRSGKPEAALHTVEALISRGAGKAEIWNLRGLIYNRLGLQQSAVDSLRQAVTAEPVNADYYIDLSTVLANLDQSDSAARVVADGIDKAADKDRMFVQMGLLHFRSNERGQAETWYRRALQINPANEAAYIALAHLLLVAGRDGEAFALLENGLERLPNSPLLNYIYGALLQETSTRDDSARPERARLALEKALTLNPLFANTHYRLGRLYLLRGDEQRAQEHFERACSLNPKHAQALYQLSLLLARQRQTERAAALSRTLSKLNAERYTLTQELAQQTLLRTSAGSLIPRQKN